MGKLSYWRAFSVPGYIIYNALHVRQCVVLRECIFQHLHSVIGGASVSRRVVILSMAQLVVQVSDEPRDTYCCIWCYQVMFVPISTPTMGVSKAYITLQNIHVIRTGTTELQNTNCPLRRKQHEAHAFETCVCLLMNTGKSAHLLIFGCTGQEGG